MNPSEPTPAEQGDRLAIREPIDAYARCADRRDAEGQEALFADDTRFLVYIDGEGSEPTQVLDGRDSTTSASRSTAHGCSPTGATTSTG
jgi:SnoaL-like domain